MRWNVRKQIKFSTIRWAATKMFALRDVKLVRDILWLFYDLIYDFNSILQDVIARRATHSVNTQTSAWMKMNLDRVSVYLASNNSR